MQNASRDTRRLVPPPLLCRTKSTSGVTPAAKRAAVLPYYCVWVRIPMPRSGTRRALDLGGAMGKRLARGKGKRCWRLRAAPPILSLIVFFLIVNAPI